MVICLKAFHPHRVEGLLLRIMATVMAAALVWPAAVAQSAAGSPDPLGRHVSLPEGFEGRRDSLLAIITGQTGIVVAYSSRALPPGEVRQRGGSPTIGQCLNTVFGRYNVRYVCQAGKIVVAADSIRMRRVSGICRDAQTGEALIGAHTADTLLRRATASNEYGYFSLSVPTGRVTLRTSFVGYRPDVRTIDLRADTTITVRLSPHIVLADIEVKADEEDEATAAGVTDFKTDEIKSLPGLLGEVDLGRALQQTPGVKSGSEGFGGMSVRGGSQDQNNILLDDAPLFNANHALGFFSAFNSDAINNAVLIKSGFPARYGGKMSSVLDVKTLDGNMSQFEGNANIGLMASSLLLQGPIRRDKASYLFSARRSYFDLFSNIVQTNEANHYSYLFYDFHAKANWRMKRGGHLRLSYFNSSDQLTNDTNTGDNEIRYGGDETRYLSSGDENKTRWVTHLASLRWSRTLGPSVFCNTTAWYSQYTFSSKQGEASITRDRGSRVENEYRNGIRDAGIRADVSFYPSLHVLNTVRIGAWYEYKRYEPMVGIYAPEVGDTTQTRHVRSSTTTTRHELHGYVESLIRGGDLWASAGAHFSLVSRDESTPYLVGEPRLLVGWKAAEPLSFHAGYSLTTQFVYQMRMLSVATPSDIWLPVPRSGRPQRSSQISVAARWKIADGLTLEVDVYGKRMRRLVTYKSSSPYEFIRKADWESAATAGKGHAHGIEFFLHARKGRAKGWFGYCLSKARNTFADINGGQEFRADNDRLHSLQVFAAFEIRPDLDISLSWNFGSGAPLTLPTQRYTIPGSDATYNVEPRRNALTLLPEHQLNIGACKRFGSKRAGSQISFGVCNVYARQNPMFVYWKQGKGADGATNYKLKQFSLLGFPWPYVKYSINF